MRIDRSHTWWLLGTLGATAGCTALYLTREPASRHMAGGTPLGLWFGMGAFAIFLFAAALGLRKKWRRRPLGSVRRWLQAHLWLSVLTVPLVLFHAGFHAGGLHARVLMALYAVVMGSGAVGLALQQIVPRLMKDRLPREVIFEQIPRLRAQLVAGAEEWRETLLEAERLQQAHARTVEGVLVAEGDVRTLVQFLDEECLPYLAASRGERLRLGDAHAATGVFRLLRAAVAPGWHPGVSRLERWCEERRWMDQQTVLHHWLHGWLLVHVPASLALVILTAWHAWSALHYVVLPAS